MSRNANIATQDAVIVRSHETLFKRCEKIGKLQIDSGCLLLSDPCRIYDFDETPYVEEGLSRQVLDDRRRCFAVTTSTGIGDGYYPVFAEIVDAGQFGERVSALHVFFSPDYCFADDPDYARRIAEEEEAYLRFMNGDTKPPLLTKAKSISERSKKMLTLDALEAMADLNAQRPDWLVYLRLLRLVSDEVQDPEEPDSRIGVVSRGQPLEPQSLFPGMTDGQLRYRMKKLVSGGLLIRQRTAKGYRLAIRFSSASKLRRVSQVSMEHFGWLRRPIQLSLPLDEVQPRKPVMPATLQMAASRHKDDYDNNRSFTNPNLPCLRTSIMDLFGSGIHHEDHGSC